MNEDALLKQELIKWISRYACTRAMVVGVFAKSHDNGSSNPDWMRLKMFGISRQTWVELPVHVRKYYVRRNMRELIDRGLLRLEKHKLIDGNTQQRLKVVSVLDRLAAINDQA